MHADNVFVFTLKSDHTKWQFNKNAEKWVLRKMQTEATAFNDQGCVFTLDKSLP